MSSSAANFGSTKRLESYSRRVFQSAEHRPNSTTSAGAVSEPLELEEYTRKDYAVISSLGMRPIGDHTPCEGSQEHIETSDSQDNRERRARIAPSVPMRHRAMYRRRPTSCFVSHSGISPSEGDERTIQPSSTSNMATSASTMWEDHGRARAYIRDGILASGIRNSPSSHFDSNRATLGSQNSQLDRNTSPDSYCLTLPARRIGREEFSAEEGGALMHIEKGESSDALDLE
jgi:hypothetical protein